MSVLPADTTTAATCWRTRAKVLTATICLLLLPAVAVASKGSGGGGDSGPDGKITGARTDSVTTTEDPAETTSQRVTSVPKAGELQASREALCVGDGRIEIDLRARDGWIEIRSTIRAVAPRSRWRMIVSHDRWIIWVGRKVAGSSGRVALRVRNKDYEGPDAIMVRANGPSGEVCRVVATIAPTSA